MFRQVLRYRLFNELPILFFSFNTLGKKIHLAYLEGAEDAGFPHAGVSGKLPETPPEDIEVP